MRKSITSFLTEGEKDTWLEEKDLVLCVANTDAPTAVSPRVVRSACKAKALVRICKNGQFCLDGGSKTHKTKLMKPQC